MQDVVSRKHQARAIKRDSECGFLRLPKTQLPNNNASNTKKTQYRRTVNYNEPLLVRCEGSCYALYDFGQFPVS